MTFKPHTAGATLDGAQILLAVRAIVVIRWTGLAPWEFVGSLTSAFLSQAQHSTALKHVSRLCLLGTYHKGVMTFKPHTAGTAGFLVQGLGSESPF